MSHAVDDFLAGSGRLVALLRALPEYAAPASLEASFAAAASAAQASADNAASTTEAAITGFEPPASLETSFLKMAASIDAAQAPRREAILAQISRGESPQATLGADLQPATAEWLQQQAGSATPAKPVKPARKPVFLGFSWFDLRLAALALILSAVGTQLVLKHQPDTQQLAVQEAFRSALESRSRPPVTPEPDLAQTAKDSLAEAQRALDRANALDQQRALEKARARPLTDSQTETIEEAKRANAADPAAEIGPPAHLVAPVPASIAAGEFSAQPHADLLSAPPSPSAAPVAPAQAGSLERPVASAPPAPLIKEEVSPRRERALGEAAPAEQRRNEPLHLAAKKSIASSDKDRSEQRQQPVSPEARGRLAETHEYAAPSTTAPSPAVAKAAAPAPAATMPAPAAPSRELPPEDLARQAATDDVFTAHLTDEPASIAARLPARPAGQRWVVYSSTPKRAELHAWVEALRLSIPASYRPGRFQIIRKDGPPDVLRIIPPPAPH
ncbi:hypothetical protein Q9Q94_12530 [Uliginosibacterium sp. 31-16]|uniref:hypothetical protein n=1 Tax=Uliginosibacterium sp. 31-16 TaxID=3068315 RepID=UPI00273E47EB|nr:hypothetical protein [Uliginosibacterium sp. 31-16]MDP5240361.1 hypothetical protein [Uliginosibacterium sp. 31-16]